MLTYVLAVLAAYANAVSSVLQRKANQRVPQRGNMSLRQIDRLLHQPVGFGGILAITAGFLLQASALGTGQLSVVEPVLGGWPASEGTSYSSGAWSCWPATAPSGTPARTALASGAARSGRPCWRPPRGRPSG